MLRPFLLIHILIMGLIFLGPFSFAQDPATGDTEQVEEIHDTKKLDKVLQDYNKDQQKVLQDAEMIREMQTTGEVSDEELGKGQMIDPENEKAYHDAHDLLGAALKKTKGQKQDLKSIKYSEAIRTAMAPLQKLSEKELLTMIKENTKESAVRPYLENFPKITLLVVRLIKDPEAIPSLVKVTDDQDKLIRFGGLMLATILVGFFLKRFMAKEGRGVLAAVGVWFLRSLIMSSLRMGLIILFFGKELTPAFNIATKTFF